MEQVRKDLMFPEPDRPFGTRLPADETIRAGRADEVEAPEAVFRPPGDGSRGAEPMAGAARPALPSIHRHLLPWQLRSRPRFLRGRPPSPPEECQEKFPPGGTTCPGFCLLRISQAVADPLSKCLLPMVEEVRGLVHRLPGEYRKNLPPGQGLFLPVAVAAASFPHAQVHPPESHAFQQLPRRRHRMREQRLSRPQTTLPAGPLRKPDFIETGDRCPQKDVLRNASHAGNDQGSSRSPVRLAAADRQPSLSVRRRGIGEEGLRLVQQAPVRIPFVTERVRGTGAPAEAAIGAAAADDRTRGQRYGGLRADLRADPAIVFPEPDPFAPAGGDCGVPVPGQGEMQETSGRHERYPSPAGSDVSRHGRLPGRVDSRRPAASRERNSPVSGTTPR